MNIKIIILAIIIIIIIICKYGKLETNKTKDKKDKIYKLINESKGVNDNNAKQAKKELLKIKNEEKTAKDEFLLTRLNHLNEHNEQFIDKKVIEGYTNTIEKLISEINNKDNDKEDDKNNKVLNTTNEFITDNIDNFVNLIEERIIILPEVNNNQINGQIYTNNWLLPADDGELIPINNFLEFAETTIPQIRTNNIKERKKKSRAKSAGKNKEEQIKEYLKESKIYTNDPQNTHDIQVNADVKKTFDIITNKKQKVGKKTNQDKPNISKIIEYVNKFDDKLLSKEELEKRKERAKATIDYINAHNRSVLILGENGTEQEVLLRTWERANIPENKKNKELIKEAIFNALVDSTSIENGIKTTVCANGTTSRILESLITLDVNEEAGKINTIENVKNMIFDKAQMLIKEEIEKAKKSNNKERVNIGNYYSDLTIKVDEKELEIFENELKEKLDTLLGEEAKKHNLVDHQIMNIRQELHAAI